MYKILVFLDGSKFSLKFLKIILFEPKFKKIGICVSKSKNSTFKRLSHLLLELKQKKNSKIIYNFKENSTKKLKTIFKKDKVDLIFSYYDKKINSKILSKLKIGGINFHPSYLPHNRGRHSTFWAIVNQTPLGASAHFMNNKFDDGPIIIRKKILDDGISDASFYYNKQHDALLQVLKIVIQKLVRKKIRFIKNNIREGSYHNSSEILKKTTYQISDKIKKIDLFNLLRATKVKKNGIFIIENDKKKKLTAEFKIIKKKYSNQFNFINFRDIAENKIDHFFIKAKKKYVKINLKISKSD